MATIDAMIQETERSYAEMQEILTRSFISNQVLVNNLKEVLKENERLRAEIQRLKISNAPQAPRGKPKTFNGVSIE